MTHDIVILGGGLSGLTAAVDLCSQGLKVLLLEQRHFLGGRTYSFRDAVTGDVVDNGQHLMMGCYHQTREYIRTIGSEHLASLQENLRIEFAHPSKGFSALACPPLPAPLHVLAGLLKLQTISFPNRLKLMNVGMDLLWTSREKERRLDSVTVDEWLTSLGQTEENKKYLWDIIAIGTLNDDPKTVSALLFFRVLRAAFLGKRENSSLLIPKVGLSELLVNPAARFIQDHGGTIRTGISVTAFKTNGSTMTGAASEAGKEFKARSFISAVPYYAVSKLTGKSGLLPNLQMFESSPIITINLWLDREVVHQEFIALLDTRIQWVFNKTLMFKSKSGNGAAQNLSLVISGAADLVEASKRRLVETAMNDLRRVFPQAGNAVVLHALVVKEKRATFSPKPGIEALRPVVKTGYRNLFLAGDWTSTGYPATIEGAVMSGKKAAGEVLQFLSKV